MSRRITTETNMNDKGLAVEALTLAGIEHRVQGDFIYLSSGDFRNSTLNLKTGAITGDSDYGHTESKFGVLRQHYGEAIFRREAINNGTVIDTREVDTEGNVILMWHTA